MKRASAVPFYRVLLKDSDCFPTCVVAGPSRRRVWLYCHATTPTVLRLHPPVVGFLVSALGELDEPAPWVRSLAADSSVSYPGCEVISRHGRAWLYVMAAAPSMVPLFPRLTSFLREVLAELPTIPADAAPALRAGWREVDALRAQMKREVFG